MFTGKIDTSTFFGATLTPEQPIQYYNEPITLTVQGVGNWTASMTGVPVNITNNQGVITASLTRPGILEVTNGVDTYKVDVRIPYVKTEDNIPVEANINNPTNIIIKTLTPQGIVLDAESVTLIQTDPQGVKSTLPLKKDSIGVFSASVTYSQKGFHTYELSAVKPGFDAKVVKRTTAVQSTTGGSIFFYIFIGGLALFLVLVIRKRFFTRGGR